jgi:hypothetical protein
MYRFADCLRLSVQSTSSLTLTRNVLHSSRSSSLGQEIDSSYDSSSDDVMDFNGDIEDLEDLEVLDLEEPSSDETNRYLRVSSSNSGQLRAPRKPNLMNKPRRAPQGWKQAKRNRHYHGFYLHTYCDCVFGNWFCFCLD